MGEFVDATRMHVSTTNDAQPPWVKPMTLKRSERRSLKASRDNAAGLSGRRRRVARAKDKNIARH